MKKCLMVLLAVALVPVLSGYAEEAAVEKAPAKKHAPACKCCGEKPMHVLSIADGKSVCCSCAAECDKCGEVKEGKCACGKEVKTCDLAGKFICDKDLVVKAEAGKCPTCGADLTQVAAKAKEEAKAEKAPEAAK